jgi:hypothetical protein
MQALMDEPSGQAAQLPEMQEISLRRRQMTMTLEDFETHYIPRGSRPHYGRAAKFLLDLEPLTPTVAAFPSPSLKSRRNSLQGQWTGTGANVAVQPVKGGSIRTATVEGDLYVVWYPEAA